MAVEIERKFLVPDFSPGPGASVERIEQGYIAVTEDGTEVRVRKIGAHCVLGVKRGTGVVRVEVEREITEQDFIELWPATEGARLVKDRHTLQVDGATVTVDVYVGTLQGLCVAEVEFATPEEAERYRAPTWFGPEVTGEPEYRNQSLALRRPASPRTSG